MHHLVQQIVARVHPRRIILFGSAARGQMHAGSDVDILIVMPDGTHRRQTAQSLYRDLPAVGIAKDLIVVTESDVQRYGDNPSLVLYPALREGKELYAAKE
ncbi:MAG: nucleotidyltransferase domain-containing protein [Chloroflexus sp.]|nr:nucleotidyltransferase domain-containing protein [Chloroflexus sp.]